MRSLLVGLLLLPTLATAVPVEIAHQGRLFDAAGSPLTGDHQLQLGISDSVSGGNEVWSEVFPTVAFDNGYYSVVLGQTNPIDGGVLATDALWLSIAVDGAPPVASRVPLTSVPFAVMAGEAQLARQADNAAHADAATTADTATRATSAGSADTAAHADAATTADTATRATSAGSADTAAHADAATTADTATRAGSADAVDWANVANVPIGVDPNTIAAGDHTHTAADVGALPLGGGTLTGELVGTLGRFNEVVVGQVHATSYIDGPRGPGRLCMAGYYFSMGHCLPKGNYTPRTDCLNGGSLQNGVCYAWPTGGQCQQLTLSNTKANCSAQGGRVCTVAELDRLYGTGCGMDLTLGWANLSPTYDDASVYGLCMRGAAAVERSGGTPGPQNDSLAACDAIAYGAGTTAPLDTGYAICCFD